MLLWERELVPFEGSCVFTFCPVPGFMLAVVLPDQGRAEPLGKPTVWVPTRGMRGCGGNRTEWGARIMLAALPALSALHPYTWTPCPSPQHTLFNCESATRCRCNIKGWRGNSPHVYSNGERERRVVCKLSLKLSAFTF